MIARRKFMCILSGLIAAPALAKADSLMKLRGVPLVTGTRSNVRDAIIAAMKEHGHLVAPELSYRKGPQFWTIPPEERAVFAWGGYADHPLFPLAGRELELEDSRQLGPPGYVLQGPSLGYTYQSEVERQRTLNKIHRMLDNPFKLS
jgi:hypothetical protein